ncbi:lipoprotein [Rhodanobacter panaciterrae]|uniref:Lipoprotein n=1 Tax=Rhodanobacter panaciterrae TaxID=490572 RepID=A0ABQ2ZSF9_9GAMM|nr:PqiC family protein [Rhodanobacter panaciterrae]GGY24060.1 lipoprotein [Rhodanobacter panaciterrae]
MIRIAMRLLGTGAALALAACASAPLHYYTLVAPAGDTPASSMTPSLPFELLPVSVPAQVDQPQLVVREGGQGVALLGSERWIAPLSDEVRSALSADLARELNSQDVSGMPGNDKPVLRIKLDLRRFDSQPGSYALIEGAWSVRLLRGEHPAAALACTSRINESVGPGYDALVAGHQRALGALAGQIATAARMLGNGQTPVCPAG